MANDLYYPSCIYDSDSDSVSDSDSDSSNSLEAKVGVMQTLSRKDKDTYSDGTCSFNDLLEDKEKETKALTPQSC